MPTLLIDITASLVYVPYALLLFVMVLTNLVTQREWTALMWASDYGHAAVVQALVKDVRVNVNLQSYWVRHLLSFGSVYSAE